MKDSYKIVLVGSSGVGKTSIMIRLIKDEYREYNDATIGSSFFSLKKNHNNKINDFQIWDTAGQERYRSLVNMYLRGCHAILLVYDVDDIQYDELNYWLKYIEEAYHNNINKPLLYLIGNKYDLVLCEPKQIFNKTESQIKVNIPIDKHYITSAKSGYNVIELFNDLTNKLLERKIVFEETPASILINKNVNQDTNYGYCCYYM